MEWYYSYDGETVEGPVTLDELKQLAADGMLPTHTSVAAVGDNEWSPLQSALSPQPAGPPPLPPALPSAPTESSTPAGSTPTAQPGIAVRFGTWFSGLETKGKLAVVGTALLVMVILFYPSGSSPAGSHDGISDAEGESLVRAAFESIPNKQNACSACSGSGQVANTFFSGGCKTCRGRGTIRTPSGYETSCPNCGGTGNAKTTTCDKCGGKGYKWGY